jgi:hypothetical protein
MPPQVSPIGLEVGRLLREISTGNPVTCIGMSTVVTVPASVPSLFRQTLPDGA